MDKRIKRTRCAIFNAVLDLTVEKEAKNITVLELCKKADINKSTFYLHYKSMEDCLHTCFKAIMDGILEISRHIIYEEIARDPTKAVNVLLDEVEKKIDYLYKFKSSSICGHSIKLLKESLVNSISENNGLNSCDNYHEILSITFAVGGCIDAIIEPLPAFDKPELSKVICDMLKSKRFINA